MLTSRLFIIAIYVLVAYLPTLAMPWAHKVSSLEATHRREYFHVGGKYTNTSSGHILQNHIYVEQLTPHNGPTKPFPIILIHGGAQTGTVGFHTMY